MKKITSIVLSVIMVFGIFAMIPFNASALTSGNYEYEVLADNTVSITKYNGNEKNVVIPSQIDGYKVSQLGFIAFADFEGVKDLKSVTIPNTVKTIVGSTFYNCKGLTEIVIPDSVEEIGYGSFINCSNLKIVTIGKGVTTIGSMAFMDCTSITTVNFNAENCTFMGLPQAGTAFYGCSNLTTLNFGDTVKIIPDYAFEGSVLKTVNIPDSVTSIGEYAFIRCENLQEVNLPNTNIKISNYAFLNCPSLLNITIPAKISEIGKYSFGYSCNYTGDEENYEKIDGVKIQGYSGTTAETYAVDNDIEFVSLGEKPAFIGDVNLDGKITISDATEIQKHIAGIINLNSEQLLNADTDGDGAINVVDATQIQKYLAGIITKLG